MSEQLHKPKIVIAIDFTYPICDLTWCAVVQRNCADFEETVAEQCNELMELIQQRRHQLIQYLHNTRDDKIKSVKQQVSSRCYRVLIPPFTGGSPVRRSPSSHVCRVKEVKSTGGAAYQRWPLAHRQSFVIGQSFLNHVLVTLYK